MSKARYHKHGKFGEIVYECPGCKSVHVIATTGKLGWEFNGDLKKPTLKPSILATAPGDPKDYRCHHYMRNGEIQYLSDCNHEMAGQTIPMVECNEKWAD